MITVCAGMWGRVAFRIEQDGSRCGNSGVVTVVMLLTIK